MITRKRLFFDIETSFNIGIFWRSGYNLNINPEDIIHERAIICVAWKWEGKSKVHSLHWDEDQSDKQLLKDFLKELNKADEIIAHNGDRFDIKWLRTRCVINEVPMFPVYQTIDTLKIAKAQFNFNSNKLDYIAQVLGVGAKTKHEGLDMWKKIVLHKDPVALNDMIEYCKNDAVVLENVYHKLRPYSKTKVNYAVLRGGEKYECPNCGTDRVKINKTYTTAQGTIKHHMRCRDKSCRTSYNINNKTLIDFQKDQLRKNIK
jgi:DNA polymerase III epsilon subunit-like protein